jgi:hypothetical protein
VIRLTIGRASIGLTPLVIDDDGTGVYNLMRDFNPGGVEVDNVYAEARWQDGGLLTSSRRTIAEIGGTIRVNAGSLPATVSAIDDLADALNQFGFPVTLEQETVVTEFTCMPATWQRAFDPVQMRHGADYVNVSIPRQP